MLTGTHDHFNVRFTGVNTMPQQKPVVLDGVEYTPVEVEFDILKEDWSTYEIDRGTLVRVRLIVNRISRLIDGDGNQAYNADGRPHLSIDWNMSISVLEEQARQ